MIIIIFLIVLLLIFLYFVYKIIVWISKKKKRINWTLILIGLLVFAKIIDFVFFTKMEFIQSKVYPDIYLVKNPIYNKGSLRMIIKKMVFQKVNKEFIGNENKYKDSIFNYRTDLYSNPYFDYTLIFYKYYKGWGMNPFGKAGTEHFIKHKEDPGGFSSELLEHYYEYSIARFEICLCGNDSSKYFGILRFFTNNEEMKIDTIVNQCNNK